MSSGFNNRLNLGDEENQGICSIQIFVWNIWIPFSGKTTCRRIHLVVGEGNREF